MFAEIIKNMYGISLEEFSVMIIDLITFLIALLIIIFSFFKLIKATKSKNAKGVLLSVLATMASSFVSVAISDNTDIFGVVEIIALLIPSIFTLISAICFYRLSNELVLKYS